MRRDWQMCDSVSLYGFTTFVDHSQDQFWGRRVKLKSGTLAHDWAMESRIWRLLHIANTINICST